jgi:5-deoxy-glucuronate isomerase
LAARTLFRSSALPAGRTGTTLQITPRRAGWKYISFAIRQIAPARSWRTTTEREECCLVLLRGTCTIEYHHDGKTETATLGPRANVFAAYPHAIYLPPHTTVRVVASELTELADGRAPARVTLPPRVVRPADCGFEIRGGGNATRQIVDIMPPSFPADRLLVCEVYTPSGNWSSYPPHKHDVDRPPGEVKLEEVYYYRFANAGVGATGDRAERDAYGVQRLYNSRSEQTHVVRHGDLVLIRSGYHPFVSAYGYNGYYLNVLAGTRRSMAASDDPRYAAMRAWPPPDPRVPVVTPPRRFKVQTVQGSRRSSGS